MTPRAEDDAHALVLEPVVGAHHVVDRAHLEVHVLHARALRGEEGDLVVHLVDAQEGGVADPVAHPGAELAGPEALVAPGVGGAQPHVAERGDPRVAPEGAVPVRRQRVEQLEGVPRGVAEGVHRTDPALVALALVALAHLDSAAIERGDDPVERDGAGRLEAERLPGEHLADVALHVAGVVVLPVPGAQVGAASIALDQLEPQDLGGEAHAAIEIGRAEAHVAEVTNPAHRRSPS